MGDIWQNMHIGSEEVKKIDWKWGYDVVCSRMIVPYYFAELARYSDASPVAIENHQELDTPFWLATGNCCTHLEDISEDLTSYKKWGQS